MEWEVLKNIFQLTVSGLAVGSIYSLVALGFVIIYKATDIFNFAQGELMTLGAFICYFFIVQLHIPIFWAFLLTFFATAIIGLVTEELFFRPMVGEPIFAVIMVTIGLSVFLKGITGFSWGYMIRDNFVRGIVVLIVIVATVLWYDEFFGTSLNAKLAFSQGLGIDALIGIIAKGQKETGVLKKTRAKLKQRLKSFPIKKRF